MANYYTKFSLAIKLDSRAEADWCLKQLEGWRDAAQGEERLTDLHALIRNDINTGGSGGSGVEFDSEIEDNTLYLSSMECGNPDQVAIFVRAYLQTFHPDRWAGFEWAYTCSSPRPDGFGGGAAFITATKVTYSITADFIRLQAAKWEK